MLLSLAWSQSLICSRIWAPETGRAVRPTQRRVQHGEQTKPSLDSTTHTGAHLRRALSDCSYFKATCTELNAKQIALRNAFCVLQYKTPLPDFLLQLASSWPRFVNERLPGCVEKIPALSQAAVRMNQTRRCEGSTSTSEPDGNYRPQPHRCLRQEQSSQGSEPDLARPHTPPPGTSGGRARSLLHLQATEAAQGQVGYPHHDRVDHGEAAVAALLRHHQCESSAWARGDGVAGLGGGTRVH